MLVSFAPHRTAAPLGPVTGLAHWPGCGTATPTWVRWRCAPPSAIEELLRFEPPGPHVARYVATADVEFHSHTVPQASALLLMLASATRDERHFQDPDRFDIHLPASHRCCGC